MFVTRVVCLFVCVCLFVVCLFVCLFVVCLFVVCLFGLFVGVCLFVCGCWFACCSLVVSLFVWLRVFVCLFGCLFVCLLVFGLVCLCVLRFVVPLQLVGHVGRVPLYMLGGRAPQCVGFVFVFFLVASPLMPRQLLLVVVFGCCVCLLVLFVCWCVCLFVWVCLLRARLM